MRRTGIKRYTELKPGDNASLKRTGIKPGTKGLTRKTRMRTVSKKRAKVNRQAKPVRDAYLAAHPICEVCCRRRSTERHEITCGPAREASLDKIDVLLAVCGGIDGCHDELDDYSVWPVTRQLALKAIRSERPLDLPLVNRLRGRDENAITWGDVAQHLTLKE
jgi:hypothetical protein